MRLIPIAWRRSVRRHLTAYREGLLANDFATMSEAWMALKAEAGPATASELVRVLQHKLAHAVHDA